MDRGIMASTRLAYADFYVCNMASLLWTVIREDQWSPIKKQDLKQAARGGESSSPDPVLNIVTKKCVEKPKKHIKHKKRIMWIGKTSQLKPLPARFTSKKDCLYSEIWGKGTQDSSLNATHNGRGHRVHCIDLRHTFRQSKQNKNGTSKLQTHKLLALNI